MDVLMGGWETNFKTKPLPMYFSDVISGLLLNSNISLISGPKHPPDLKYSCIGVSSDGKWPCNWG